MSDNKPEDGEKPVVDTTDAESSSVVSHDDSPDDVELAPVESEVAGAGDVDAAEAAFAASETGLPVEADSAVAGESAPVEAAPIAAAAAAASRPIWSDAGDAPFDDRKVKIPGPAKVRVKDDDDNGATCSSALAGRCVLVGSLGNRQDATGSPSAITAADQPHTVECGSYDDDERR